MRSSKLHVGLWVLCLLLASNTRIQDLQEYRIQGYAQGTDYSLRYYASDSVVAKGSIDSVLAVIDSSMSLYKPYSLINQINNSDRGGFDLDEHFHQVVEKSFEIYRESKGVFDITVAPLVQLWGFGVQSIDRFPDSSEVRQALACVGMDKIKLTGKRMTKTQPCVQLDVNGIAQGYSVDVLAAYLESKGVAHYMVELGGELRVKGPKPDGSPFRVGIERPVSAASSSVAINDVVTMHEGAITTAGNYRKFLQQGDRSVSHHIDSQTGYPFDTGIISATIYAQDAITADGYDNVIMAMTVADAITFVNQRSDMDAFLIYKDAHGAVKDTMSYGFRSLIAKN